MTSEPAEAQAFSSLISDVFCECRGAAQADVGRLSRELFLKVDVEGRSLCSAADAVGLTTGEARTVLFLFRRQMAGAMVGSVSTSCLKAANHARGQYPRGDPL